MCASARAWGCALGLVWVSLYSVGGSVALGGARQRGTRA
jgi:hypothetical protein